MRNLLIIVLMPLFLVSILSSCNDNPQPFEEIEVDLTEANRNFLFNTGSARTRARLSGIGPVGFLFRINNRGAAGRPGIFGRSTNEDTSPALYARNYMQGRYTSQLQNRNENQGEELPGCLREEFVVAEDGSFEYLLDFGDGCEYFGDFFVGKIIESGNFKEDTFYGQTEYDNFGSNSFMIDGVYAYEGRYEGLELDTLESEFGGEDFTIRFSYEYEFDETYEEEDGQVFIESDGSGLEETTIDGYTILAQETNYSYNSGEEFTTVIITPLFTDFTCSEGDVFSPVSGVEEGTVSIGEIVEEYSIDYGEGECDNIIVVTQDGKPFTIDLAEEWESLNDENSED